MERIFNILGFVMLLLFVLVSVATAIGHIVQGNYLFGLIIAFISAGIVQVIYKSTKE